MATPLRTANTWKWEPFRTNNRDRSLSSSSVNPDLLSPPTSSDSALPPSAFYSTSARNRPVTPPQNASNPTSTPISNKTSASYTYASRDSANYHLALETSGLFLGAMPPNQFLDKFLPISQDVPECPNPRGAFASVGSTGKEGNMHAPFIAAAIPFAPKLKFIDTHANPDTQRDKLAPDIGVYPINDQPQGDAKTDFSKMDVFVEFKGADTSDPFRDPEDPLPNIAPFGKGNDIRDHTTLTHTLRDEKWACWSRDMVVLRHYRMSLDVVARPLTSFCSSREFVSAIADAMAAHQVAYFNAHVLHCDISAGNILITDDSKGLLIDWDLCVNLSKLKNDNKVSFARRPDRTGTWQFMSAALLQDNGKCNELEDDRESCLHVLTWTAAFDEEYEDEDGVKGGDLKKGFLLGRDIPRMVKFDRRPQLDALIRELTEAFAARYEEPPSAEQISQLQRLRDKGLTDDELGNDNVVLQHTKRVASLKSPGWLVDTLRRHLNAGSWPPSDKAQGQPIGSDLARSG